MEDPSIHPSSDPSATPKLEGKVSMGQIKLFKKNNSQGLKLISPGKIKIKNSHDQVVTKKQNSKTHTERNTPSSKLE